MLTQNPGRNRPPPVDLTNFHELTGGDSRLEALLLVEFIMSFNSGLERLKISLNNSCEWKRQSQILKGLSLNVGATALSELCKRCNDAGSGSQSMRQELIKDLLREYEEVRQYLKVLL